MIMIGVPNGCKFLGQPGCPFGVLSLIHICFRGHSNVSVASEAGRMFLSVVFVWSGPHAVFSFGVGVSDLFSCLGEYRQSRGEVTPPPFPQVLRFFGK